MITIDKTQKRAVLTAYIAMEERHAIVWVQADSSRPIMGIEHFMQNTKRRSTWAEIMKKRFICANRNHKKGKK